MGFWARGNWPRGGQSGTFLSQGGVPGRITVASCVFCCRPPCEPRPGEVASGFEAWRNRGLLGPWPAKAVWYWPALPSVGALTPPAVTNRLETSTPAVEARFFPLPPGESVAESSGHGAARAAANAGSSDSSRAPRGGRRAADSSPRLGPHPATPTGIRARSSCTTRATAGRPAAGCGRCAGRLARASAASRRGPASDDRRQVRTASA